MVKIAAYNVENLFARPRAFDGTDWSIGEPVLAAYREVNDLFQLANYDDGSKDRMKSLLLDLDIYRRNSDGALKRKRSQFPRWAWMRKNRGSFDREPRDSTEDVVITASGRSDWIGWVELAKEPVNEISTRMTAQVIRDLDADIIAVVEAEDRPSLVRFNKEMLDGMYRHIMLIDGNDERGIDVGLMTKAGFPIGGIRSNVDREDSVSKVFSRDCPQYEVQTPNGGRIHILVNHFKSQSGGGGERRLRQAQAVRDITDELNAAGEQVIVLGDLNEGPTTEDTTVANFDPMYSAGTSLVDCYSQPAFDVGTRLGTFDSCGIRNRLDYIFMSNSLIGNFQQGGIYRKGLWGTRQSRPTNWETYTEMTRSAEQASDHAAVFIELDI